MAKNQNVIQISVKITPEDKERLEQIAGEKDMSMAAIVRQAIKDYLQNYNQ